MRNYLTAVVLAAIAASGSGRATAVASTSIPALAISYSDVFDHACADATKYEIGAQWSSEARSLVPDIAMMWDREKTQLIGTVIDLVGKGFKESELQATATVCNLPPMSHPLLFNFRNYLRTFTRNRPKPLALLMATIQHELLHWYVDANVPPSSPLLTKYRSPPYALDKVVLNHLHVLAIQKAVYERIGRQADLVDIRARDNQDPLYRRAWEIVDSEGASAFVADARK